MPNFQYNIRSPLQRSNAILRIVFITFRVLGVQQI